MPLLRINATDTGLQLHGRAAPVSRAIREQRRAPGPVIIMLHGYKYAPGHPTHCPHGKIYSETRTGWPRALGFLADGPTEGLGIAFGWYARGPLWQAHRRAARLGRALAGLIRQLREAAPQRPVHVIAHSMGSEIALSALAHLPPHAVQRMVLLTGASFASHAREMLRTPAGRTAEVFNITSRENDLFDLAFEHLVAAPGLRARALGRGVDMPNAVNLQLDCRDTLSVLDALGVPIAPAQRRICHWSSYKRPGAMAFYARLLRAPDSVPRTLLAHRLPDSPTPRWSRLMTPPPLPLRPGLMAQTLSRVTDRLRHRVARLSGAATPAKAKGPAF